MKFKQVSATTETFSYPRLNGLTQVTLFRPQMKSSGICIVFCHGTGNDRFYPQHDLFQALLQSGHSIFTFDLDGHGIESTTQLTVSKTDSCVEQAIEQCKKILSPNKIILIGHSLGAVLALKSEQNLSVAGVVAISPPIDLKLKRGVVLCELIGILKFHTLKQIFNYGFYGSLPSAGMFRRKDFPIRLNDESISLKGFYYLGAIQEIVEQSDIPSLLANPHKPRLIITGSRDVVAPAVNVESHIRERSLTSYHKIPGENHVSLIFSATCHKLIIDFLARLSNEP